MLKYTFDELQQAVEGAGNLNAAIKKILKSESSLAPKSTRFLKDFRVACAAKDPARKIEYLKAKAPEFETEILVVVGQAYSQHVAELTGEITTLYADKFNATYSQDGEDLTVKDRKTFEKIVSEVMLGIDEGLKKRSLPSNGFMKNVMLQNIFDAEVLKEIMLFLP
jgi:hypothetical protein